LLKVFKNLSTDLKIIVLDYQNNYEEISSMMSNTAKSSTFHSSNYLGHPT